MGRPERILVAISVALSMLCLFSGEASAAGANQISLVNEVQSDGGCNFTLSFSWTGYSGGSNDSMTFSLHIFADGGDHEVATQPFSPVAGQGGSQTYTFHTFSGTPGGPGPVIAIGDWYGRAVLSSKSNSQGSPKVVVDVSSSPAIHAACRAL